MTGPDVSVVLGILTYRRPADLPEALDGFLAQAGTVTADVALLVVDNDPEASAAATVAAVEDPRVRYVHEPRPGIAAARNRALAEVQASGADLLVFVDDDERPSPRWLEQMLGTWTEHGRPACVVGRVVSEYAVPLDPWMAAGRFFDRRRLPTGTEVTVAATNNLLIDMSQLARLDVTFDEAFGLSGGSDTLFTRTLAARGARLVWCDEAAVVDMVPAERLTRAWVLRKARRIGNCTSRVEVVLAGSAAARVAARARCVVQGTVRVLAGSARRAVGLLTRSAAHDARGLRTLERGRGMVSGALGHVVYEYKRD